MDFKIALVNPETVSTEMREMYDQHENHAPGLIAARLRSLGYQVDLYDLRIDGLTECEMAELFCTRKYRIIGFSVNYATLRSALRISERLEVFHPARPVIIFGGEHVTYEDMSILSSSPAVDIICCGEGEITFCDVVNTVRESGKLDNVKGITFRHSGANQISRNPEREPNPALNDLPYADHDIAVRALEYKKPVRIGVLFARGCPYPCVFCNAQRFLGIPLLTLLLSALCRMENVSKYQITGLIVAYFGVMLTITNGKLRVIIESSYNTDDILLLLSTVCFGIYNVLTRRWQMAIPGKVFMFWFFFYGSLALIPWLITEHSLSLMLELFTQPPSLALAAIIFMSLGGPVIAYLLFNQGIAEIGASRAASFINLVPLITIFLSVFVLKEQAGWPQWMGAIIILTGVYMANRLQSQ